MAALSFHGTLAEPSMLTRGSSAGGGSANGRGTGHPEGNAARPTGRPVQIRNERGNHGIAGRALVRGSARVFPFAIHDKFGSEYR